MEEGTATAGTAADSCLASASCWTLARSLARRLAAHLTRVPALRPCPPQLLQWRSAWRWSGARAWARMLGTQSAWSRGAGQVSCGGQRMFFLGNQGRQAGRGQIIYVCRRLNIQAGKSLRSTQQGQFEPASPSCLPFPASLSFAASSLMFCTNGVLLRMLTGAGRTPLAQVTHLVRSQSAGAGG